MIIALCLTRLAPLRSVYAKIESIRPALNKAIKGMRFTGAICSVGNDDHLVEISPVRALSGVSDSISIPVIAVNKDPKGAYEDDAIPGCVRRISHVRTFYFWPSNCVTNSHSLVSRYRSIATPIHFGFGDGICMTRFGVDIEGSGGKAQSVNDEAGAEKGHGQLQNVVVGKQETDLIHHEHKIGRQCLPGGRGR